VEGKFTVGGGTREKAYGAEGGGVGGGVGGSTREYRLPGGRFLAHPKAVVKKGKSKVERNR